MVSQPLSDLAALAVVGLDDIFLVTDDPGGTPVSRKVTQRVMLRRPHGQIYVTGGSASQAIALDTWTPIDQFAVNGLSFQTTPAHGTDKITIPDVARFVAGFSCSFIGDPLVKYDLGVYWNGSLESAVRSQVEVKASTSTSTQVAAASGLIDVTLASRDLELWVKANKAAAFAIVEAQLFCHLIY